MSARNQEVFRRPNPVDRTYTEMEGFYQISGEEFVLLATSIAISLAQGKTAKEVRFLSNLFYQISVSLGAISTQKGNQKSNTLIV